MLAIVVLLVVFTVVTLPVDPRWASAYVSLAVPAGRCFPIPSNISNENPI